METVFRNRHDAGKLLAKKLISYKGKVAYILALPRGGVVVAHVVAKSLHLPHDVIISRKIGSPNNPEFGIGAVSENDSVILDQASIETLDLTKRDLDKLVEKEKKEVDRRIQLFRDGKALPSMEGKTVIILDDGLATGVTARAAVVAVEKLHPQKIVFAAPICAADSVIELQSHVDEVSCLYAPMTMGAIGAYYQDFSQTTDREVLSLLKL